MLNVRHFTVEPSFWKVFPDARIYCLLAEGIDNHSKEDAYFRSLLSASAQEAEKYLTEEIFSTNPVVAEWRQAFSAFKTKKGARSSIEALLKRVNQRRDFHPINPLVDIYNSISLRYGVPCGGEDIAKISGDMKLGKAQGGEAFLPLGAEEDAPALKDEIIYSDDLGAVCRCLNWREAQRTMLTEETEKAIFFIETVNEDQGARGNDGIAELKKQFDKYFGIDCRTGVLTKEAPMFLC